MTYRRYVTLHGIVTFLAFSIAATWIILSAVGHDKAKQRCVTNFFNSASDSTSQEGDALCNIFSWVTVGVMGGLWLMLAVVQVCVRLADARLLNLQVSRSTSSSSFRPTERTNVTIMISTTESMMDHYP